MKRRGPSPGPRSPRVPRLPPKDVPLGFYRRFGDLDPAKCKAVAVYVDWERRSIRVDMALIEIGARAGFGFGRTKGFDYLKAGRYLLHQKETKQWQGKRTWT